MTDLEGGLSTLLSRVVEGFQRLALLRSPAKRRCEPGDLARSCSRRGAAAQAPLALRRAQPTAVAGSSVGGLSALETEAALVQLAACGRDSRACRGACAMCCRVTVNWARGFLMEWLEGETLGQRIVNRVPELAQLLTASGTCSRGAANWLGRHALD